MLQPNIDKLDCIVRVVTPENVEFEYMLAGPFQRALAFVFDFFVRIGAMVALLFLGMIGSIFVPFGSTLSTIAIILAYFVLSWFYGVYFESRFNGRTLGKMLFKLRVISIDGRPINGIQAALRNLLRLADVYPSPLVGLVSMTMTDRFQRLGDLTAGTMVIVDRARRAPWDLQPDDARAFGLAELIPASFVANYTMTQTIGMYMENRRKLPMSRRLELAKYLAGPLIKKFEMLPDTSPDLLLCALFVRIFMSEQQQSDGREKLRAAGGQRAAAMAGGLKLPTMSSASASKSQNVQTQNVVASSMLAGSQVDGSKMPLPSAQSIVTAPASEAIGANDATAVSRDTVLNKDDEVIEIVAEIVERDVSRVDSRVDSHGAGESQRRTGETN